MPESQKSGIYYGWKIVFAILVLLTFATGLSFYNHAVILNALAQQPQFSVGTASVAVSLFFLSGGVAGLWMAKWVHHYDPRYCICFGALVSGLSLALLAWVTTAWQLYLLYLVFGVGFSGTNIIPATTLVTRWFHRKRAVALSVASTGLSLGGVLVTPLCALLVDTLGLVRAAPIMGLAYLIGVVPVALIWLRSDPESMGLQVDGASSVERAWVGPDAKPTARERTQSGLAESARLQGTLPDGKTYQEARQTRQFWGISLAYIFLMMAQVGGIAHQYGLARELLSDAQTAIAVAILPIASIIGRLAGGWLVEHFSIRAFALGMMLLQTVSLLVLASGFSVLSLCVGLGLFGITVGNLLMLQPLLIAEAFGIREYPRIFAVSNFMSSWGTASGPALLGAVYATSSYAYGAAYLVAAFAGLAGLLLFLTGGPIRQIAR